MCPHRTVLWSCPISIGRGLEVEVAALFEAGGRAASRRFIRRRDRGGPSRVLWSTARCCLARGSSIVRVMLPQSDGSLLRLNVDGPLVLRDYFGSSGGGADLTVWIQTAQGAVSFAASYVSSVGSSYVNFNSAPGCPVDVERYRFRRPVHPWPHPPRSGTRPRRPHPNPQPRPSRRRSLARSPV